MEHSAKDILDMAKRTLGEPIHEETQPEVTEFVKSLGDIPLVDEYGNPIDSFTGEVKSVPETEELEPITSTYTDVESLSNVSAMTVYEPSNATPTEIVEYTPPPVSEMTRPYVQATTYNKFADFPQQLREDHGGLDLHEVKKLNLAAMIETLEQATTSYASFPSSDAALAISSISAQVHKLTQELEKSNDPKKLAEKLELDLLNRFAMDMLQAVSTEFKYFMEQALPLIPVDKQGAFTKLVSQITSERMGPAMQETLVNNKVRLLKVLGIKEKI